MLSEIRKTNIFNEEEFGIYRDDGLAVIQSKSPRTIENTTKNYTKFLTNGDLK